MLKILCNAYISGYIYLQEMNLGVLKLKREVNGEIYNTEKGSEQLTEKYCKNEDTSGWQCETLYRRDDGKYFLYGEGGINSPYAAPLGENGKKDGDAIIPLTDDEAKSWAEENLSDSEVKKLFK